MLKLENVSKTYRTTEVETAALEDLSLEVQRGEFLAIMGLSGCGKSTLLNILGLIDARPPAPTGSWARMLQSARRHSSPCPAAISHATRWWLSCWHASASSACPPRRRTLALVIALLTVGAHAVLIARAKPVIALRYE